MYQIGLVNIDTSHPDAFGEYLLAHGRARYAAVYNDSFRDDRQVAGFIKKYNLDCRCGSIEELAEMTDIGFIQGCNWDLHLSQAMPFLARNKPVFIDKPIVGSLADCIKLDQLAAQGCRIWGSSSLRYCDELTRFMALPPDERGEVLNFYGTCGVDDFNYGIHIIEAMGALLDHPAACTYLGGANTAGITCDTYHVHFADGKTGVYSLVSGTYVPFEITLITTKQVFQIHINTKNLYGALLDRICDALDGDEARLAPVGKLTESIRIALAGLKSRVSGGQPVRLASLSPDDPGYDGAAFQATYAAKATPRYL
jgi:hypothetical protein